MRFKSGDLIKEYQMSNPNVGLILSCVHDPNSQWYEQYELVWIRGPQARHYLGKKQRWLTETIDLNFEKAYEV